MSSSTKILLVNSDRDLSEALIYQLSLNDKYQIIESGDDNVFTQINKIHSISLSSILNPLNYMGIILPKNSVLAVLKIQS